MFGTKKTGYEGRQGDDEACASVGLVIPGLMRLTDTETVGDQEKEKGRQQRGQDMDWF